MDRSLYRISMMRSIAVRAAIILEPKVEVSTVRWRREIQTRGVLLMSNRIPVTDRRVTRFRAWSASTKYVMCIRSLSGCGIGDFLGSSS